jgi:hypothetical protein
LQQEVFDYLRRENAHFTIHAGEAYGLPSIWEAIQLCGAERLGHGVRIIDDIDLIPSNLRGIHQDNPVNVVEHAGVQLELPPRVRGSSPLWWDWEGPGLTPHTERLIDALVECATTWEV